MERILLIQPNYPSSSFPAGKWPIGLGHIAESLNQANIEYRVVDMDWHDKRHLYSKIKHFRPSLIGISMMTCNYKQHYELLKEIKLFFPNIKIVAGGPHISYLRKEVLQECPEIDFGVIMEGEETIVELCKNQDISRIGGFLYREGSLIRYTGERSFLELDRIPFPTYAHFEIDKYSREINIVSSRGCPYRCIFCGSFHSMGRKWRGRSALNLIKEIEYWYERGFRNFSFVDSNFLPSKERVYNFCDEVEKRGLKIKLHCQGVRADSIDRKILERMKEVGFYGLDIGVEASNNKILNNLKKGETIELIEKAIKNACDVGFNVILFFLIGSPGETADDVVNSFKLAKKYPISNVWFFNLTPLPKTELYAWVIKNDYLIKSPKEYLNTNYGIHDEPVFFTPTLGIEERKELFKKAKKLKRKIQEKYRFRKYIQFSSHIGWGWLSYPVAIITYPVIKYLPERLKIFLKHKLLDGENVI